MTRYLPSTALALVSAMAACDPIPDISLATA